MNRSQRVAAKLLREHQVDTPPVDVIDIARHLGLSVVGQPLEDSVSGMLVVRNGQGAIGINESHHPNRQRFTIAHELGHYLLHKDSTSFFLDSSLMFYRDASSSDGTDAQEREANAFAAALLMPEDMMRDYIALRQLNLHDNSDLNSLATRFKVSEQALILRLVNLHILDAY